MKPFFLLAISISIILSSGCQHQKGAIASFDASAGLSTISGVVYDDKGKPLSDIEILLTNKKKDIKLTCISNPSGFYAFYGLPPGDGYNVWPNYDGYIIPEHSNLNIPPFSNVNLPVTVEIGTINYVSSVTPVIDYKNIGGRAIIYQCPAIDVPSSISE